MSCHRIIGIYEMRLLNIKDYTVKGPETGFRSKYSRCIFFIDNVEF